MTLQLLILLLVVAAASIALLLLVRRFRGSKALADRARVEDALKHLYHTSQRGEPASVESLAGALGMPLDGAARLLQRMMDDGLVVPGHERVQLSSDGSVRAIAVIRSHRLWERFLADETLVDSTEWHGSAERAEHRLTPEQVEALAKRLGQPLYDPHGDPIPTETGVLPEPQGLSLPAAIPGNWYMVVHVEDEPPSVFRDLLKIGVQPGVRFPVEGRTDRSMQILLRGVASDLPMVTAANVTLSPSRPEEPPATKRTLDALAAGGSARIHGIAEECRGLQRRRLLDLGLVPGTRIAAEFTGPTGDPTAYRIRGSLIALRREQAVHVMIEEDQNNG